MILSGKEIINRLNKDIFIEPYSEQQVNPNSYNLTLSNELMIYTEDVLDLKKNNKVEKITIPIEGFILYPDRIYLAKTVEYTKTYNLVPMIFGRSSLGRLGLFVHAAGLGDTGYCGVWTLQLICTQPIRIYPGIKICQICYHTLLGQETDYCSEKYQNSKEIINSKFFSEINT